MQLNRDVATSRAKELRLRTPLYYGYYLVAAAFGAQFVAMGVYSYVLGSFMEPMVAELNWTRAEFTLSRTISQVVMALVGIFVSVRVDRHGARPIMLIGTTLLAITLALHSQIQTLWGWLFLNGIFATIGCAMLGNLVVNVTLAKWFVENRGQAVAVAAMGVSFGGILLTPVITWGIDTIGWRDAWIALAIGTAVMMYPIALTMRRAPEDYGLNPDGKTDVQIAAGQGERAALDFAQSFTRAEAMRTFSFYALVIAFGFFSINIFVLLLHTIPYLTDSGVSRADAAFTLVVASIPALDSKPIWGYLIDRTPAQPLAAMSASVTGISLCCIILAVQSGQMLWIHGAFFLLGLGWGGMLPMQEVIWASFFGRRFLGAIRGAAMPFALLLGAFAPYLVSVYRDATGGYDLALWIVAALNITSGVLIYFAPSPRRKPIKA